MLIMQNPFKRLDYVVGVLKGEREDRRRDVRVRTLRRCRVIFGEQGEGMRCFLMDLSNSGARLRPANAEEVPDSFELEIESDLKVPCKVIRRTDNELGVAFRFGG